MKINLNTMQKPKILIDTSSWINIYNVDLINYLIENFSVFVTPKVADEILDGKEFAEDARSFERLLNEGFIQIVTPETIQEEIKHEISISSGEIEIIAYAIVKKDCTVVIDDSRVYRVMDRFNLKYLSSANIVIDAYLAAKIDKGETHKLLERLRNALKDEVIDKAKEVLDDAGD